MLKVLYGIAAIMAMAALYLLLVAAAAVVSVIGTALGAMLVIGAVVVWLVLCWRQYWANRRTRKQ